MLSKVGNKHMRTLNNTEWGGGGAGGSNKIGLGLTLTKQSHICICCYILDYDNFVFMYFAIFMQISHDVIKSYISPNVFGIHSYLVNLIVLIGMDNER